MASYYGLNEKNGFKIFDKKKRKEDKLDKLITSLMKIFTTLLLSMALLGCTQNQISQKPNTDENSSQTLEQKINELSKDILEVQLKLAEKDREALYELDTSLDLLQENIRTQEEVLVDTQKDIENLSIQIQEISEALQNRITPHSESEMIHDFEESLNILQPQ